MRSARTYYRLAVGVAVGTVLLLMFGIGALGIIGARGTAVALAVAAVATLLVGLVAVAAGLHRSDGASVVEILGLSGMYAGLFAVSAWLFHRAEEAARPARR